MSVCALNLLQRKIRANRIVKSAKYLCTIEALEMQWNVLLAFTILICVIQYHHTTTTSELVWFWQEYLTGVRNNHTVRIFVCDCSDTSMKSAFLHKQRFVTISNILAVLWKLGFVYYFHIISNAFFSKPWRHFTNLFNNTLPFFEWSNTLKVLCNGKCASMLYPYWKKFNGAKLQCFEFKTHRFEKK